MAIHKGAKVDSKEKWITKETCFGFALHRYRLFSKEASLCGGVVVAFSKFLKVDSRITLKSKHAAGGRILR